jgi:hypothetical protein
MTRRFWLALALLASLTGCAAKPVACRTEVSVAPGEKPGTYVVEARIEDLGKRVDPYAPRLIVLEGVRGQLTLTDKDRRTVVTALVERPKGQDVTKVNTTIVIEKENVDVWSGNQTILFKD